MTPMKKITVNSILKNIDDEFSRFRYEEFPGYCKGLALNKHEPDTVLRKAMNEESAIFKTLENQFDESVIEFLNKSNPKEGEYLVVVSKGVRENIDKECSHESLGYLFKAINDNARLRGAVFKGDKVDEESGEVYEDIYAPEGIPAIPSNLIGLYEWYFDKITGSIIKKIDKFIEIQNKTRNDKNAVGAMSKEYSDNIEPEAHYLQLISDYDKVKDKDKYKKNLYHELKNLGRNNGKFMDTTEERFLELFASPKDSPKIRWNGSKVLLIFIILLLEKEKIIKPLPDTFGDDFFLLNFFFPKGNNTTVSFTEVGSKIINFLKDTKYIKAYSDDLPRNNNMVKMVEIFNRVFNKTEIKTIIPLKTKE
jgi:hypothetical protein